MCQKVKKGAERDKVVLQCCGHAVLQSKNSDPVLRFCGHAVLQSNTWFCCVEVK
jgi:hypothetical protein